MESKHILSKMGFSSDSHGIISRYIKVNGAWDEHLNRTKQFILNVISNKKIRHLAVYGSGWLLDFPIDEISPLVEHIWLYDLIHPSQILHKIKKYPNVTAINKDIAGDSIIGAYNAVYNYKRYKIKPDINSIIQNNFTPSPDPDFAISLNILSQLGELIINYLKRYIKLNEIETDYLNHTLQQSHLRLLKPEKSCLITDIEEYVYNFNNRLVASKKLVNCEFPSSKKQESWEWQFDPLGEYHSGLMTISKVIAMEL